MKMLKSVIFVQKDFKVNAWKKKYHKVRDHCHHSREYRGVAQSIFNLKYNVPKKIYIVFHNGSNYNYHIIIKELAKEFGKS